MTDSRTRTTRHQPVSTRMAPSPATGMPDVADFASSASPLSADPVWQEALDWLLRVQAHPNDAGVQVQLNTWLAQAPAHQQAYRKAERVWQLSAQLDFQALSPAPSTKPRRFPQRALFACAASLLLAVLLYALPPQADHHTARGEHAQWLLEDGSTVMLGSDSAITLSFTEDQRHVRLLKGQAFFQVRRDSQRPFLVEAERLQVKVTGTAFAVDVAEQTVGVAVRSGSVQVSQAGRNDATALGAGDQLLLDRLQGEWQRQRLPSGQIAAWRDWQFLVHDRPLAEVVEALRDYVPGVVLLTDTDLGAQRLTASLDLQRPRQALEAAVRSVGGTLHGWSPYLLVITAR